MSVPLNEFYKWIAAGGFALALAFGTYIFGAERSLQRVDAVSLDLAAVKLEVVAMRQSHALLKEAVAKDGAAVEDKLDKMDTKLDAIRDRVYDLKAKK